MQRKRNGLVPIAEAFDWIKKNLEAAVEEAIKIRKDN